MKKLSACSFLSFNCIIEELKPVFWNDCYYRVYNFQLYHRGIETLYMLALNHHAVSFQLYHRGIETLVNRSNRLPPFPFNCTIEELKHRLCEAKYYASYSFQLYHRGIETNIERPAPCRRNYTFNCTIEELKRVEVFCLFDC